MNRDLRREIIGCLRVAGSVEGHLRSLRNFHSRDWEASLDWLNLSGIALVLWDRLQKLGAEDAVPRRVRATLAANLSENRRRVVAMTREFDLLNRQFERAGVECVVWKGFALIPDYCPDACLRPSYDYDYLVSEESWDGAQEVLQAAGYVRKADPGTRIHLTFVPRDFPRRLPLSRGGLYAATLPRKVELHLSPWDEDALGISLNVRERPWGRKVRRSWQGLTFYSPEEQDAFVFQAVHAFQHILHNWCRLGWLLEIAYFLESRSTDSSFWEKLYADLEAHAALREVVALATSLAAPLFRAESPASIKDQVPGAMRRQVALWVDHYGLRAALDNFSEDKCSLFLYREFVRDEKAWQKIQKSRLLPLHRPNRLAGSVMPATSAPLPESWKQAWYVVRRLIHHSVRGAGYAWESARWDRLRRLSAGRDLQ